MRKVWEFIKEFPLFLIFPFIGIVIVVATIINNAMAKSDAERDRLKAEERSLEKINIEDQYHTPGCETCDHGSSDTATLVCYEVRIPGLGD
jgi:hypothetical protein